MAPGPCARGGNGVTQSLSTHAAARPVGAGGNRFDSWWIHLINCVKLPVLWQGNRNVDSLKIPLSSVSELGFRVAAEADARLLQPHGAEALPLERVVLQGVMLPMGGGFLFQGRVSGVFVHPCDRCLVEARSPFEVEVAWIFTEGGAPISSDADSDEGTVEAEVALEEEAEERFFFEGAEIDLAPQVWEEAALAAPVKFICRPDCQGLCPSCGVNRNVEQCSCREAGDKEFGSNQGLAGLAELFPDLAPKRTKE